MQQRTAAQSILKKYLNPNSYDDLRDLLVKFPGHVVELTTLDRCFGLVEHHNAIVWEVRNY